jgi:hypothetical protein
MRLDPDHTRKLSRAIAQGPSGGQEVSFDIPFMSAALERLNMWERGLLTNALLRSAQSRHRTIEQRALLALFVHDDGGAK